MGAPSVFHGSGRSRFSSNWCEAPTGSVASCAAMAYLHLRLVGVVKKQDIAVKLQLTVS